MHTPGGGCEVQYPPSAKISRKKGLTAMKLEIYRLVTNECANHEKRFNSFVNACLIRRDLKCVFFFEDHPRCKYFEEAVLPLDKQLEALYHADREARARGYELTKRQKRIIAEENAWAGKVRAKCERCGEDFPAANNRQKYCTKCRKWVIREQTRIRMQKKRAAGVNVTH